MLYIITFYSITRKNNADIFAAQYSTKEEILAAADFLKHMEKLWMNYSMRKVLGFLVNDLEN